MADSRIVIDCTTGITTVVELTPDEISQRDADRVASEARASVEATRESNSSSIRSRAAQALTTNADYLAQPAIPASPTLGQLAAATRIIRDQVDALTRQANALIRLELAALDDTDGT